METRFAREKEETSVVYACFSIVFLKDVAVLAVMLLCVHLVDDGAHYKVDAWIMTMMAL